MGEGYIYIMRNPCIGEGTLKIGRTTKQPETRADDLSNTSVPEPFEVVSAELVGDCRAAEQDIHNRLKEYRVTNGREFFRLSERKACEALSCVAERHPPSQQVELRVSRGLRPSRPHEDAWLSKLKRTPRGILGAHLDVAEQEYKKEQGKVSLSSGEQSDIRALVEHALTESRLKQGIELIKLELRAHRARCPFQKREETTE